MCCTGSPCAHKTVSHKTPQRTPAARRAALHIAAAIATPEAPSATASSGGAGTRVMIIGTS